MPFNGTSLITSLPAGVASGSVRKALFLLTFPNDLGAEYRDRVRASFPDLTVELVNHHSKVGPHIAETEILLTFGGMMSDKVLAHAAKLKWIQALGTGVDGIVDQPSLAPDVLVTNMRGIHGAPVSEAAMTSMLALSRDLPRAIRNQGHGVWDRFMPSLLKDKTVGIFGLGLIAEELALKCKAFGMNVIGITSTVRNVAGFDEVRHRDDLEKVIGDFDFFVLLVPYSAETRGIVGGDTLARLSPHAYLVNVSRGGVVDEEALLAALHEGRFAGAALDVFTEEPLPSDSPLWKMDNVLITPKQGGYCDVYIDHALPIIEENMRKYLAGAADEMRNVVAR
jgi:D-2-hydroxyacid dehydrogenase (NADP+)